MSDLIVALDSTSATQLVNAAEAALGTLASSGSGHLGPFGVNWSVAANFSGGSAGLTPPKTISLNTIQFNYQIKLSFELDLNDFLPHGCLPQVCVTIPFIGQVCTPKICVEWPTVTIPLSYSDALKFSADFNLNPHLQGNQWLVDLVIVKVPDLQLSLKAAAIVTALGAVIGAAISVVPLIGPFIGVVVAAVIATIGLAGALGLLGDIITPFISGRTFTLVKQTQTLQLLPAASALEPAVNLTIAALASQIAQSDKPELVVSANFSV
jgi:hypothetical protein